MKPAAAPQPAARSWARAHLSPQALAQLLTDEIQAGRYAVGSHLPTELALQAQFGVSRYCVREALRTLKECGMVSARAGVGHVVLADAPSTDRYMQTSTTLPELVQSASTTLKVVALRETQADAAIAQTSGFAPGALVVEIVALRTKIGSQLPTALLTLTLRPAHALMARYMEGETQAFHMVLEQRYGVRIDEVQQRIVAVLADAKSARLLALEPRQPCLRITRRFLDAQGEVIFGSVGLYPGERFSHDTAFKVRR